MIFNFKIRSTENDKVRRDIQIDPDATFLELKNAICDSVGYDKGQLCSFFICDDSWERREEIAFADLGFDEGMDDLYLMEDTIIRDFVDEGQRLLFVFDYMTDRSFRIKMDECITGTTLHDPVCVFAQGVPPKQSMELEDFDDKQKTKKGDISLIDDIDEEFYGSDAYNEDEFDPEGFSEDLSDDYVD